MSGQPTIPPRPSRAQNSPAPSSTHMDVPKIPPRPNRGIERSVSPHRDTFARSPLNDPTFLHNGPPKDSSRLSTELPPRPPSVSMPSLGEEGNEYASFDDLSKTLTNENEAQLQGVPQQTKSIAGDLPLYAPTASVPSSTAKRNIAAVTRTDSSTAMAAGLGKPASDDKAAQGKSSSRPSSLYNEKDARGIPEIGVQVPMFRNAGDVQAPTPSPFEQQSASTGVGFHNKPSGRHHGRTKSGREIFHGPPGSYGMHGHGVISKDEFEQKWYEKHPEDLKREKAGEYGPHIQENRKDYHWRSDNLEKLVHTRGQDASMGTSHEAVSTPDEQIGYMATEAYAMRMASPRPASSARPASIKGGHVDSPLRQEGQATDKSASEQRDDNGEVYHIDPPAHRSSKIHGGGYDPPTADLGPEGGNTSEEGGWVTERGYGTPILASDELKKRGSSEWRQPAVSPELERRGDEYTVNEDGTPAYITKPRPLSRSSSQTRVQRVVPSPAHFDRGGTPLESHKEYEPLFPEDEDSTKKPKSQADKLKRPSARHQFPSQDVWEDTPGSLQLETTVETPQAPEEHETPVAPVSAAKVFEKPETEERRKEDITKEDQQSFLPEHTKRFAAANKHLTTARNERPGMQQRFPSQDIWEDAPDHGHLETTVSTPQIDDTNEYAPESPVLDKPIIPARPSVPSRPQKAEASPVDRKAPVMPERPKPQLPARPTKSSTNSSEKVPTLGSQAENDGSQPKAKSLVPGRPGGSKIAALQAGFMKDLNSKLGLGPQVPKVKEPEPEEEEPAQPLTDARKSRAKGPQRRKPAASPAPAATITAEVAVPRPNLEIGPVTAIWSFGEDGLLDVPAAKMAAKIQQALEKPKQVQEMVEKPKQVEESPEKPKQVEEPLEKPKQVEEPLQKSEGVQEPLQKPESVKEPSKQSEQVEEPSKQPEPVAEPSKQPEPVAEPSFFASAMARVANVVTGSAEPAKPTAQDSQVAPAVKSEEPATSKTATSPVDAPDPLSKAKEILPTLKPEEPIANTVPSLADAPNPLAKAKEMLPTLKSEEPTVSSPTTGSADASSMLSKAEGLLPTIKPEEPLVTQTASGSAEAPGAFPAGASGVNAPSAGSSLGQKTQAEPSVKLANEDFLEKKHEPATGSVVKGDTL
ncbi:hypothetical protein P153DRAFT_393281 [Dothidotthia symphoricarpi CBS 119687]|uniref:Altered inheritance of mitochondria protein 21 n=1 Tax=Dothidotthia symphoricarpi CBS 119687 TaxID=1392245 RepID=A0A6A6ASF4_9PLEO|nr:uncharacterized protein P153DRAFT_393281 [Dothidotthia symphoricarpi CBS 119687]KAF2133461.1 hypothetical protein P153DRAFT_393281 [Dothidotthia symphoricarpi CBS 119687]